ncbi:ROK family protein, partial [Arthrobacter sp. AL08]|nr:ROK family protein [Arthrobacter sp. AL08]
MPTTRRGASSSSNTTALGAGYVGLDIGGTGIKGGLVDVSSGELLGSGLQVPTPVPATPGSIINTIAEMIRHL